ncbi:M15 family metallopeptidase [Nocardioides sp. SYSU DS0651]|uniref:M15 family metallopeptidase n=1 Tax=Nocardioides sp. SYSU DS0651 TaxID=3415955 RepID=UPI003F4BBB67
MTHRRTAGALAGLALSAALLAAACTGGPGADAPEASRSPETTDGATATPGADPTGRSGTGSATGRPSPDGSSASYSQWELGATPLPLRPDGFGQVLPTPPELRVRRFPTRDLLPPPADGRFHATIGPVTPQIRRRMGETWSPRCPVDLEGLRYVTVTFRGFDGEAHTGELVLAAVEAEDVVSVFRALFRADFPIEEMRLPTTADLEAHPTGDGNNTAALVCRASRGTTTWSAHAYGLAIDINPFLNPYHKGDLVLPELASAYLDRSRRQPGIIRPDSVAVREFARIGWSWGGAWRTLKDYQHFSATGR